MIYSTKPLQNEGILPRQGTYSGAVHECSKIPLTYPVVSEDPKTLVEVSDEIKTREEAFTTALVKIRTNLSKLQNTGKVKRCLGRSQGSRGEYDNRYYELLQQYVNSYDALSKKLKDAKSQKLKDKRNNRTRNELATLKQIGSSKLPVVSTSEEANWGLQYGYALVNWDKTENHKPRENCSVTPLTPEYQADGHPRFPYLGVLYVYLHSPKELNSTFNTRILDLFTKNLLDLQPGPGGHKKSGYIKARERVFDGGLSSNCTKFSLILRVPNFSQEWQEYHLKKYGLTKIKYNQFKNELANTAIILPEGERLDENDYNLTQQKIIEYVIAFYDKEMYRLASEIASEAGAKLKFLGPNSEALLDKPAEISDFVEIWEAEKNKGKCKKS